MGLFAVKVKVYPNFEAGRPSVYVQAYVTLGSTNLIILLIGLLCNLLGLAQLGLQGGGPVFFHIGL